MSSSKSFVLLKLSLSPSAIGLLHTLHTELNAFLPSNPNQSSQQSSPKEILEGIFQVVAWDLKVQITHEEFSVLFKEWSKAKGSLLSDSNFFEMTHKNQFPIEQIILALRNIVSVPNDFQLFLTKTIELMSYEYDSFLSSTEKIGLNSQGLMMTALDRENLALMDEIFKTFDQKEQGHLTLDALFFLYIALQESENQSLSKEFAEEEAFCTELNNQFKEFVNSIKCFQGRITSVQMKMHLMYNGRASKSDLNVLRKSVRNIIEMALDLNENVMQDFSGMIPDLLQIAVKKVFPGLNLIELNKNPTDLQLFYHFLLIRFYPFLHEQDYFEGLFISNKTLLAQMMLKEARKYYGEEVFKSIQWSFDPIQAFLGVIGAFNELANQLLHFYFQFKTKESLFTGRSVNHSYFQEGINLSKDNINTSMLDYSQRNSRSMFSGRGLDAQLSFRGPLNESQEINKTEKTIKMVPSQNTSFKRNVGKHARGSSENLKKDKENNMNKLTQRNEKPSRITEMNTMKTRRNPISGEKKGLSNSQTKTGEIKKGNFVETPVKSPQTMRRALEEVDINYTKKLMLRDETTTSSKTDVPLVKNIEKTKDKSSEKLSKKGEDILTLRRNSSAKQVHMPQESYVQEQKATSHLSSKPPLKRQNSFKKVIPAEQGNYESFNPRFYDKSSQPTETESNLSYIEKDRRENSLIVTNKDEKALTTPDDSFLHDKSQMDTINKSYSSIDINRIRTQNQLSWQQEKNRLEKLAKRSASTGGFDETTIINTTNGSKDLEGISISEIRRASLQSNQDPSNIANYSKSIKNKDIMEILGKLDSKINEGKQPQLFKCNEILSSESSQKSESKTSFPSRNSSFSGIVNNKIDEGRSILEIVKDHFEKDKSISTHSNTRTQGETDDSKKEFYLNLKELVNESKNQKNNQQIQKPAEPKVFSMSIADHIRQFQDKKDQIKIVEKVTAVSPIKDKKKGHQEAEVTRSNEKNRSNQNSGLKKNNLTVKTRQSSSKSPAQARANRATKTESFEVVMERLKKAPGNTPTKGKHLKKAF